MHLPHHQDAASKMITPEHDQDGRQYAFETFRQPCWNLKNVR
jgi:hypothetical protein